MVSSLTALNIKFDNGNAVNTIYPVILKDDYETILVDCGYPGFLPLIKSAAESKGINLEELTKIIITHHDFDHMGALAEFKSAYPKALIVSSGIEEKYISGKEKSIRLQQAEALYDSLPEDQKAAADSFHNLLRSIKTASVDVAVKDRDVYPWCGGAEIVATPGHMPGHISIYLIKSKTLIAGDALVIENGELCIANPQYTLDMERAKASIKRLLDYDIEKIVCYHGGEYTGDIKGSLRKML